MTAVEKPKTLDFVYKSVPGLLLGLCSWLQKYWIHSWVEEL